MPQERTRTEPTGNLVSIIIPTLNEERSLPTALDSISSQTLRDYEVIVVDSGSVDRTGRLAHDFGAVMIDYPGKPMGARYEGLKHSRGSFIFHMDADQVLRPDTLERAMAAIKDRDMLVLEEVSYRPQGFLQRSIARQRLALHQNVHGEDGIGPNLYPRFFRRGLLVEAYSSIPDSVLSKVFTYDDAFLFRKTHALSKKIGVLENAIMHIEEENWIAFMKHAYRTGRSAKSVGMVDLVGDLGRSETVVDRLKRAVRSRSLVVSSVKEFFFQLGYRT